MSECAIYFVIIIVLLLIIIAICPFGAEQFNGGPPDKVKKEIVEKAMSNKHVFDPARGTFDKAKSVIKDIDNITYEDFRNLHRKGQFSPANLYATFAG